MLGLSRRKRSWQYHVAATFLQSERICEAGSGLAVRGGKDYFLAEAAEINQRLKYPLSRDC